MVNIKWDFITVVYSNDRVGRDNYQVFKEMAPRYYICIDKSLPATTTAGLTGINTNGVVYLGSEKIGKFIDLSTLGKSITTFVTFLASIPK